MKSTTTPEKPKRPTAPEKEPQKKASGETSRSKLDFLYSRAEHYRAAELKKSLQELAQKNNGWFRENFGERAVCIDEKTGELSIKAFKKTYDTEQAETHENYTAQNEFAHHAETLRLEKIWAAVEPSDSNASISEEKKAEEQKAFLDVRKKKMKRYGIKTNQVDKKNAKEFAAEEQRIATELLKNYREERELKEDFQLEKMMPIVFSKVLGDKFLITPSAAYDNYKAGIDTIILDKESGNIVCAIDEVRGFLRPTEDGSEVVSERERKKTRDIYRDNLQGGRSITYGLSITTDPASKRRKLYKGPVNNLPVLCLSVSGKELETVLGAMYNDHERSGSTKVRSADGKETITMAELDLFDQMLGSLREQALNLATFPANQRHKTPEKFLAVQQRASDLAASCERMAAERARKFPTRKQRAA